MPQLSQLCLTLTGRRGREDAEDMGGSIFREEPCITEYLSVAAGGTSLHTTLPKRDLPLNYNGVD